MNVLVAKAKNSRVCDCIGRNLERCSDESELRIDAKAIYFHLPCGESLSSSAKDDVGGLGVFLFLYEKRGRVQWRIP